LLGIGAAAVATNGSPKGGAPRRGWVRVLAAVYVALLCAITAANAAGPDRWWPAALNLYLPQWIWLLPAVVLCAAAIRGDRVMAVAAAVSLGWVAGPLMGFCWPIPMTRPTAIAPGVRIMTYNVKWGRRDPEAIVDQIREANPDIILMQDADGRAGFTRALDSTIAGWHWTANGQYITASRSPLTDISVRSIEFPGGHFSYLRCMTMLSGRIVTVYNVHLFTPREGLTALRSNSGQAIAVFEGNVTDRLYQAGIVAENAAAETGPLIVAGDLNAPVQSLVCRSLARAGLADAFSAAGRGYGYTYGGFPTSESAFIRIDHIYLSRDWTSKACWAGSSEGSEHCPVICDAYVR
jgi:vancomycin resistance protein VanJ